MFRGYATTDISDYSDKFWFDVEGIRTPTLLLHGATMESRNVFFLLCVLTCALAAPINKMDRHAEVIFEICSYGPDVVEALSPDLVRYPEGNPDARDIRIGGLSTLMHFLRKEVGMPTCLHVDLSGNVWI